MFDPVRITLSHSVEFAAEELAGYSAEFAAEELAGYSTECGSDPFMLHLCAALAEKERAMISRPEPLRSRIIAGTLRALSAIVRSLRDLNAESLPEATVKGGPIVAWGKTDIYDPASELHRRFEIGVTSEGRFHSVDPGKLTMAPYFAEVCAARISPVG